MATTAAVQGAGLVTGVWKKLEKAIFKAGGTEEHLARLDKAETDAAFANFAAEIVRTCPVPINSFCDLIRAGNYDNTYLHDDNPEKIKGQSFHPVTSETELDHPAVLLTNIQIYEKYGSKMADLSEFLDYGIKNPGVQREFPIGIMWKDGDQFWYAALDSDGSKRVLTVHPGYSDGGWHGHCRFLIRK